MTALLTDEEIERLAQKTDLPHFVSHGMKLARSIYEARLAEDAKVRAGLVEALDVARTGLFHEAPESCWATGPSTGDDYEDLVVCPGCRGIAAIDAALAAAKGLG